VKLLLDEMWPPELAIQLRRHGHDVTAVTERPELRGQSDVVIFATAQAEGRAIVTENVGDYRVLAAHGLRHGTLHAGLIFTSNRRFPRRDRRTTGLIVTALDALLVSQADLTNQEHWLS
jgi:hypothetical protein